MDLSFRIDQGTTATPIDLAEATTHLASASKLNPDNLISDCLISAILKMCFNETSPTVSLPGFIAPFSFPFVSLTPAACNNKYDVVGVRVSKVKDRSGRTVTRVGIGVPWVMCAVRALNSYNL